MSGEFVDTNIIVYSLDVTAGTKNLRARELMARLWEDRTGAVSVQIFQEFYVTITRKVRAPVTPRRAVEIIEDLSGWMVHEPKTADIVAAAQLSVRHQISFWDAMVVRSALETGSEIIWTEDLQHGQKIESVEIRNPFV
jgi:predicted nucleic acid-binding protein